MKKTLLLFSFIFLSICGFAQSVSFGVRGGITWASERLRFDEPNYHTSASPITTFSVGGFADITCGDFSLEPGIFFSGQGGENKYPPVSNQTTYWLSESTMRLWYIEVPIDIIYHLPAPFKNVYVGAGPYIAAGISGKDLGTVSEFFPDNPALNNRTYNDYKVRFDPDDYRRFQFGANAIAGVRFKNHWLINIGYDLGLTAITHVNIGENNIKNDQFTVSVGYCFK